MGIKNLVGKLNKRIMPTVEKGLKAIPPINRRIEAQYDEMMAGLDSSLKPYRGEFETVERLPLNGRSHPDILAEMAAFKKLEQARWQDGYVSGAVYHGDDEHINFLNQVYTLHSQSNPLHADVWPSTGKFEAEIVSMTAHMLGAGQTPPGYGVDEKICGTMSSGGTESILLAMKTYRDWARDKKGIKHPGNDRAGDGPRRVRQGGAVFQHQAGAAAGGPQLSRRLDGRSRPDHAEYGRYCWLGPRLPAWRGGSHRGNVYPGAEKRHWLPHRRLPGRVCAALGQKAGLRRAPLRLPPARCYLHVGRYAQIRLCRQGYVGGVVPGGRAAPLPIFYGDGLAGWFIFFAVVCRAAALAR
jgi:hypothetical protein